MFQERPDGDAGGGYLRREPHHRQPLLRPFAQGNLEREHPRGGKSANTSSTSPTSGRGKRGRGAAGKTPVFGLLKRGEKVFVTVVSDCSRESLMPIIKGLILEQSRFIRTAGGRITASCSGGYEHYRVSLEASLRIPQRERVRARQEPCQRHREHANQRFAWSFAKRMLAKFNGCSSATFVLLLEECALATKFQAVALQPPQRRPAASYQETVQENVS